MQDILYEYGRPARNAYAWSKPRSEGGDRRTCLTSTFLNSTQPTSSAARTAYLLPLSVLHPSSFFSLFMLYIHSCSRIINFCTTERLSLLLSHHVYPTHAFSVIILNDNIKLLPNLPLTFPNRFSLFNIIPLTNSCGIIKTSICSSTQYSDVHFA